MNKIINLFSLALFAVFGFLAIGSIYDLGFSVYEVNDIPYIKQIVYGIALVILLLGVIRIKRRFEGKKDIKTYSNFKYSTPISKTGINSATLFLSIEIVFGIGIILILLKIQEWDEQKLILPLLIVIIILVVENLIYLFNLRRQQLNFKIGIGPQFLAYFDREMHLYYYKGLMRVEIYQDMINFKYKKDLNLFLSLDLIPSECKKEFFIALENAIENKNVFFADSYRQYLATM